jgi:hypothetical protein
MKIDISFITINYNSSEYTQKLIESIEEHTSVSYEIIIIDNDSREEEKTKIRKFTQNKKHIKLIENKSNCGFACGNMIGSEEALGKYLFFINNDTKLLNDTAKILKEFLESHTNAALATAKILDENNTFHSSYKLFPSITKELFGNSIARLFNHFPSNKKELTKATQVEVISGSCMFFKREIFQEIAGFDTHFFLYCEEEDISKRVWNAGYEVYFVPQASIYHKGGGSMQQNYNLLREYYISYQYLIKKHFNFFTQKILLLLLYIKLLRRSFKKKEYKKLLFDIDAKKSLQYYYKKD